MRAKILIFLSLLSIFGVMAQGAPVEGTEVPALVPFYIQSALEFQRSNEGFWDIPGNPKQLSEDMEIKLWALSDRDHDRQYRFVRVSVPGRNDFYEIMIGNTGDARVTASGGKKGKGLFKKKGGQKEGQLIIKRAIKSDAQTFSLQHVGNGRFKIVNIGGEAISLDKRSTRGGTILLLARDMGGLDQQWVLIDTRTNKPFMP